MIILCLYGGDISDIIFQVSVGSMRIIYAQALRRTNDRQEGSESICIREVETVALLHEDLVLLDAAAPDRETLLRELAQVLLKKGYVKDSYPEAILAREAAYPTGLNTKGVALAMPHAAAEHAEKAAILVARLKEPVVFKEMGGSGKDVPARLVFMLAVDDPEGHVIMLGKFMSIFTDETKLVDLYETNDPAAVVAKLEAVLS